ncbi:hypothetical protein KCU81_g7560, partial [Aureobasidium melanogenum]|uniref:Uncharacterized protein n=1 Tax=Aureobasidium melanogenum (strain CBS 110374) TaxID=1043003 RepID=A0A074VER4_AURM1
MSHASEAQAGILRPMFWAHVSTDDAGFSSILHMRESAHLSSNEQSHGPISTASSISSTRSSHSHSESIASTCSTVSTDITASSLESSETEYPVQIRIQQTPQKRKPVLRRCWSPITESLREIRQRQSEEDLRNLYEAQTLAYLNDAIQF